MMYVCFMDMHSGGGCKLDWQYIFVEADSEAEGCELFEKRFDRDPFYVTCNCCGPDYSVSTYDKVEDGLKYKSPSDKHLVIRKPPDLAKRVRELHEDLFGKDDSPAVDLLEHIVEELKAARAEIRKQVFGSHVVFDREVVERAKRPETPQGGMAFTRPTDDVSRRDAYLEEKHLEFERSGKAARLRDLRAKYADLNELQLLEAEAEDIEYDH